MTRLLIMHSRIHFLLVLTSIVAVPQSSAGETHTDVASKPNIVWIISEDMGPDLGCWGTDVHTPNIDQLAKQGMRFTRVFGTASVCMPNRTAMITGITQTTLGSVTMRPPKRFMRPLPADVKPLPVLMRELGYFTGNIRDKGIGSSGKDDWNFRYDGKTWDTSRLSKLASRQPFFAQFNFYMSHRPFKQDEQRPVDPDTVELPPYYPDHLVSRQSWADYLESIQHLDQDVAKVLEWLEREGLTENTIVFFLSDHGEAFLRGKYFLYDCGLNQPLIVRWPAACKPPPAYRPATSSDQLLAAIDITAQTLACAGGQIPDSMHGQAFLTPDKKKPRSEVFSAADWIGGSRIKSRSIHTDRYKYIRNFNTELSVASASSEYRKAMHPLYHLVKILSERDELSPLHQRILLDPFPEEELYDLDADPHELDNLAEDPQHASRVRKFRSQLEQWIKKSGDLGFEPLEDDHQRFFQEYRTKQAESLKAKKESLRKEVLELVDQ